MAFQPHPLADDSPQLSGDTYLTVANARAALAALDNTARHLPNPRLLRLPTLRREAQSTSALEGTYEPLEKVLTAGEDVRDDLGMTEVLNYVEMAEQAFEWVESGRPLSLPMLCALQATLVSGTRVETSTSGRVRPTQVVIGRRQDAVDDIAVKAARFVPMPPGLDLEARIRDLLTWIMANHSGHIDPVVAAAMAHYQFEALHPFHDGNGRIGRLLIVLHFHLSGTLSEPTLTVSPWFEARRDAYYDRLLKVSSDGDWDSWVRFFASGIDASARATHQQVLALIDVQESLKDRVRASALRADTAHALVDYAVARPTFTVRQVQRDLGISYGRANSLVDSLIQLDVLSPVGDQTYNRRFYAPAILDVLVRKWRSGDSAA